MNNPGVFLQIAGNGQSATTGCGILDAGSKRTRAGNCPLACGICAACQSMKPVTHKRRPHAFKLEAGGIAQFDHEVRDPLLRHQAAHSEANDEEDAAVP